MSYNSDLQSNNEDLQRILDEVNALPEAGTGGSDGFSPIATVTQTDTGAVIEITDKYGKTEATVNHGKDGTDASVTKDNINRALGYTPADPGQYAVSVKALGAKGDGSTDDTAVIQSALATYRKVYIPGGTYKVSGELVIRDNCQLELAQDVVLNFTQASGNCITMNRSAFLKGNHATVFVPYVFVGRVINVDTSVHTDTKDVPPWVHWDPQWKTARYLTDLNICKTDSYGLSRSTSGDCNGTALYVSAVGGSTSTFIWGMNVSGLRIAGAFEYGIRAENKNSGWNHEMRIEAVIDGCKIGCSLENCNNSYASVVFQPRAAANETVYCEHGIQLISCENTDLTGSRVWDWGYHCSKFEIGGKYQHLALYGNCRGTILNDYNYHYLPGGVKDIRELIYTDTPANFDSLIILQEPFTRWFKPIDTEPYFDNGDGAKRLVLKEEQDALFQTDYVPAFTDQLAKATDGAGAIFNEIGYKNGYGWAVDGKTLVTYSTLTCTGYIKCKPNSIVRVRGMSFKSGSDDCRIIVSNSNLEKKIHVNRSNVITNASYYHVKEYTETDDGFSFRIVNGEAAYFTLTVMTSTVSANPVIAVDEEIVYTQEGFLADGIRVKEPNILGMDKYERTGRMVTAISSASTNEQYPTAKAVYTAIQEIDITKENIEEALGYTPLSSDSLDEITSEIAGKVQLTPEFADSVEDCTDTTKMYVLPDGYIYRYLEVAGETPEIVITGEAGGYYYVNEYNHTGVFNANASCYAKSTNIIPVTPGDQLSYMGYGATTPDSLVWLTSSQTLISEETYDARKTAVTVTAPANAAFVRFFSFEYTTKESGVVLNVQWVKCQAAAVQKRWVNTGLSFVPADNEDRIVALEKDVAALKNAETEVTVPDVLKGKKIVYDGDSICQGYNASGGYPAMIAAITGGTAANQGVGGARLCSLSGRHSVVDNISNLPQDGDLYCFQGGINDWWANTPVGTFSQGDYTGTVDPATIYGAMETIFRYALNNFVGKPICFVITHKIQNNAYSKNTAGNTFWDYRKAMIDVCEKYSIPYYDAFTKSGLNGWNDVQKNAYLTGNSEGTADGTHPNEEGYKRYYVPQLLKLFREIMPN